jgi:hypothetical protein
MHLAHALGHQDFERLPDNLFLGVPEDARSCRVPEQDDPLVRLGNDDTVHHRVEERPKAELMRQERLEKRFCSHVVPFVVRSSGVSGK